MTVANSGAWFLSIYFLGLEHPLQLYTILINYYTPSPPKNGTNSSTPQPYINIKIRDPGDSYFEEMLETQNDPIFAGKLSVLFVVFRDQS